MPSSASLLERTDPGDHVVQLYGEDDELLTTNVSRYLHEGLKRGEGLLVIATPQHTESFTRQLIEDGSSPADAVQRGQLVFLDAHATLEQILMAGQPSRGRFRDVIGGAMRGLRGVAPNGLRAFGELVGLLWSTGEYAAANRLEEYWNELLAFASSSLFCAYPIDVCDLDFHLSAVGPLLCAHTHVLPPNRKLVRALNRALDEVLGGRAHGVRVLAKAVRPPFWAEMSGVEDIPLWLRNIVPDHSDEILNRARRYFRASEWRVESVDN